MYRERSIVNTNLKKRPFLLNSGKTTKDRKKSITNFLQHFSRSTRWDTSCFKKKKKKKKRVPTVRASRWFDPVSQIQTLFFQFTSTNHFQTTKKDTTRTDQGSFNCKKPDRRVFKSKLTQRREVTLLTCDKMMYRLWVVVRDAKDN